MRAGGSLVLGPSYRFRIVALGGLIVGIALLLPVAFDPTAYSRTPSNEGPVFVSSGTVAAVIGGLLVLSIVPMTVLLFQRRRLIIDADGIREEQRRQGRWQPVEVRDRHSPDPAARVRGIGWREVVGAEHDRHPKRPTALLYTLRRTPFMPEQTFAIDSGIGGNRTRLAMLFRAAIREFGTTPGTPGSAAPGPASRHPG